MKAVPVGRYSIALERSIVTQVRLWEAGFRQMARPIPATDGSLTTPLGDHVIVAYDCIDGVATSEYPLVAFVDLLAGLHRMPVSAEDEVERFDQDTTALVVPFVAAVRADRGSDRMVRIVQETLEGLGPSLDRDIATAQDLRASLARRTDLSMVVTHYDAPGNVMVEPGGRLVLVDWDELLVAPRERDTWSQLIEPETAATFLMHYRRSWPHYEPDVDALRHYLLKWYFEEIEGLGGTVLDDGASAEERSRYLRWFSGAVAHLHDALRRLDRGEWPWLTSAVAEPTSGPPSEGEGEPEDQQERRPDHEP